MKIPVPNAEIIFDDDIMHEVKNLLREAAPADTVYLVTPYVRLDTRIKAAVEEARNNKVEVRFLIRADADHSIDDVNWLQRSRVEIRQVKNLHAKIYLSSKVAIIASMNLHTFSGSESKECGVKVTDEGTIGQLHKIVDKWHESQSVELDIVSVGKPTAVKTESPARASSSWVKEQPGHTKPVPAASGTEKGFCIRCGKQKTFNPQYPLCDDCYKIWAKYSDKEYEEKQCHRCGKPSTTSVLKPLCRSCWADEAKK